MNSISAIFMTRKSLETMMRAGNRNKDDNRGRTMDLHFFSHMLNEQMVGRVNHFVCRERGVKVLEGNWNDYIERLYSCLFTYINWCVFSLSRKSHLIQWQTALVHGRYCFLERYTRFVFCLIVTLFLCDNVAFNIEITLMIITSQTKT